MKEKIKSIAREFKIVIRWNLIGCGLFLLFFLFQVNYRGKELTIKTLSTTNTTEMIQEIRNIMFLQQQKEEFNSIQLAKGNK